MSNASIQKWLGALLCVLALGSTAALAEPDTFYLGSGRNGSFTAQALGVNVNGHGRVTAPLAPGDTAVPVDSVRCPRAPCFEAGDLVLVLRTTGLTPVPPLQTPPAPLDLSGSEVGRWELARLASVSASPLGMELTLSRPLVHAYAAEVTQVVRVPEYTDVTIPAGTGIGAYAWNGLTGGVVAFLVQGRITLEGEISASNAGFRGGVFVNDTSGKVGCAGVDEAPPSGAQKGEGVASTQYGPTGTGRGHATHGGGGGVCSRSGGGGGGHGGKGGQGGDSADNTRAVGGQGGVALLYSQLDRLTLGGGGGAGHSSLGTGTNGGHGGGALFIRAGELTGTGLLSAYGASGGFTNSDAGSGGGAGGGIYLRLAGSADCGGLDVSGGTGGSSNASKVGPGGGGGGGRVLFQSAGGSCSPDLTSVIGAAPGSQKLSTAPGGVAYGAQSGDYGTLHRLTGGFALPAVPTVDEPAPQPIIRERRPSIRGTAPVETKVIIFIDGVEVGWTMSNSAGEYVFTPPQDLLDGDHTAEAATERDGVRSANSPVNTFTVDATPPARPVVLAPTQGAVTNDSTPVLTGTAEPGSSVTVLIDGVEHGPVTADASGNWSYTPTEPLDHGGHTVRAQARDSAGNVSPMSDARSFQVDTVAPSAPTVLSPVEGASTTDSTPTLTGTAEAGSDVTVLINGVEHGPVTADASGNWSYTPSAPLPEGPNEVRARATDTAGNASVESPTRTFRVDTLAPLAPTVLTPADLSLTQEPQPLIRGEAEPHSQVTVVLDGVPVAVVSADPDGFWRYTPAAPLLDGAHTVKAQATDAAGNTGPASSTHTFTVDSAPPDTSFTSGPTGSTREVDATFGFEATEPGVSYECSLDGGAFEPCSSPHALSGLSEGTHTLQVRARDTSGNVDASPASRTWTVDLSAPTEPEVSASLNGAYVGSTPVLTGTAEPGSSVTVLIDGVEHGPVTADASGTWSYTPTEPLSEGPHEVRARASDEAGNTGPVSEGRTFIVGEPPPDVPSEPAPLVDRAFRGDGLSCAATGGDASLVLLALGSFAALARRRRRR